MRLQIAACTLALCGLGLVGCHLMSEFDADKIETTERKLHSFPQESSVEEVDLLIVVDTRSASQLDEFGSELEVFVLDFMRNLYWNSTPYVFPIGADPATNKDTLHLGFVSGDVGTPNVESPPVGCTAHGHGAALIRPALPPGHPGSYLQPFLVLEYEVDELTTEDSVRVLNYRDAQGDASDIPFAEALAHLWAGVAAKTSTCPFQQPLNAAQWALEYHVDNLGFHRADAALGLLFVSPGDDCSANYAAGAGELFSSDSDPALGPLGVFRCFEFGTQCAGDDPRSPGVKTECEDLPPYTGDGEDDRYMLPAASHFASIQALKGDRPFVAAAATGLPDSIEVALDAQSHPQLLPTPDCDPETSSSYPAVRLQSFVDNSEADYPLVYPMCLLGWWWSMSWELAGVIKDYVADQCLDSELVDTDPSLERLRPDCTVWLVNQAGTASEEVVAKPLHCDDAAPDAVCWKARRGRNCPVTLRVIAPTPDVPDPLAVPLEDDLEYDLVRAECAYHLQ